MRNSISLCHTRSICIYRLTGNTVCLGHSLRISIGASRDNLSSLCILEDKRNTRTKLISINLCCFLGFNARLISRCNICSSNCSAALLCIFTIVDINVDIVGEERNVLVCHCRLSHFCCASCCIGCLCSSCKSYLRLCLCLIRAGLFLSFSKINCFFCISCRFLRVFSSFFCILSCGLFIICLSRLTSGCRCTYGCFYNNSIFRFNSSLGCFRCRLCRCFNINLIISELFNNLVLCLFSDNCFDSLSFSLFYLISRSLSSLRLYLLDSNCLGSLGFSLFYLISRGLSSLRLYLLDSNCLGSLGFGLFYLISRGLSSLRLCLLDSNCLGSLGFSLFSLIGNGSLNNLGLGIFCYRSGFGLSLYLFCRLCINSGYCRYRDIGRSGFISLSSGNNYCAADILADSVAKTTLLRLLCYGSGFASGSLGFSLFSLIGNGSLNNLGLGIFCYRSGFGLSLYLFCRLCINSGYCRYCDIGRSGFISLSSGNNYCAADILADSVTKTTLLRLLCYGSGLASGSLGGRTNRIGGSYGACSVSFILLIFLEVVCSVNGRNYRLIGIEHRTINNILVGFNNIGYCKSEFLVIDYVCLRGVIFRIFSSRLYNDLNVNLIGCGGFNNLRANIIGVGCDKHLNLDLFGRRGLFGCVSYESISSLGFCIFKGVSIGSLGYSLNICRDNRSCYCNLRLGGCNFLGCHAGNNFCCISVLKDVRNCRTSLELRFIIRLCAFLGYLLGLASLLCLAHFLCGSFSGVLRFNGINGLISSIGGLNIGICKLLCLILGCLGHNLISLDSGLSVFSIIGLGYGGICLCIGGYSSYCGICSLSLCFSAGNNLYGINILEDEGSSGTNIGDDSAILCLCLGRGGSGSVSHNCRSSLRSLNCFSCCLCRFFSEGRCFLSCLCCCLCGFCRFLSRCYYCLICLTCRYGGVTGLGIGCKARGRAISILLGFCRCICFATVSRCDIAKLLFVCTCELRFSELALNRVNLSNVLIICASDSGISESALYGVLCRRILSIYTSDNGLDNLTLDIGGCLKNLGLSANNVRFSKCALNGVNLAKLLLICTCKLGICKSALYGVNTCIILCAGASKSGISKSTLNGVNICVTLCISASNGGISESAINGINTHGILLICTSDNGLNNLTINVGGCIKNLGFSANDGSICKSALNGASLCDLHFICICKSGICKSALYGVNTCVILCAGACKSGIGKSTLNGVNACIILFACTCKSGTSKSTLYGVNACIILFACTCKSGTGKSALYGVNVCIFHCISACNLCICKLTLCSLCHCIGLFVCSCNACARDGLTEFAYAFICAYRSLICIGGLVRVGKSSLAYLLSVAFLDRLLFACATSLLCLYCFLNGFCNDSCKNGVRNIAGHSIGISINNHGRISIFIDMRSKRTEVIATSGSGCFGCILFLCSGGFALGIGGLCSLLILPRRLGRSLLGLLCRYVGFFGILGGFGSGFIGYYRLVGRLGCSLISCISSLFRLGFLIRGYGYSICGVDYDISRLGCRLYGINCLIGGLGRLACLIGGLSGSLFCLIGGCSGLIYRLCALLAGLSCLRSLCSSGSSHFNCLVSRDTLAIRLSIFKSGNYVNVATVFICLILAIKSSVGIEVSKNSSALLRLILLFLSGNKLCNLCGRSNSNEACTFNKLFDILLLNEVVNFLLCNGNIALSLNLSAGVGGFADSIHPTADCFNGFGILCDASGIGTNNLLFGNDFFLIINSSINIGTLRATNGVIVGCRFGYRSSRINALADTANEAALCRSGNSLHTLGSTGNGLCGVCLLNDALGERTILCGSFNNGLTLDGNVIYIGYNDALLCKKGNRNADHRFLRLSLHRCIRIRLGNAITQGSCNKLCGLYGRIRIAYNSDWLFANGRYEGGNRRNCAIGRHSGSSLLLDFSSSTCFLANLNNLMAVGIFYCNALEESDDILGICECTFVYSVTKLNQRRKVGLAVFGNILCICVTERIDFLTAKLLKFLGNSVVELSFFVYLGINLSCLALLIASLSSGIAITKSSDNLALVVQRSSKMSCLLVELGCICKSLLIFIVASMLTESLIVIFKLFAKFFFTLF